MQRNAATLLMSPNCYILPPHRLQHSTREVPDTFRSGLTEAMYLARYFVLLHISPAELTFKMLLRTPKNNLHARLSFVRTAATRPLKEPLNLSLSLHSTKIKWLVGGKTTLLQRERLLDSCFCSVLLHRDDCSFALFSIA
jgi:hypothetical protein